MDVSIIVALIALGGVIASPIIKGAIDSHNEKKKEERAAQAKIEEEKRRQEEERRKEESEAKWRLRVEQMIQPTTTEIHKIQEDIDDLKEDISNINGSLALDLRVDMEILKNKITKHKVPATTEERSEFVELYKRYCMLGGNHFAERVDEWGKEIGFTHAELESYKTAAMKESLEIEKEKAARRAKRSEAQCSKAQ